MTKKVNIGELNKILRPSNIQITNVDFKRINWIKSELMFTVEVKK